MCQPTIGERYFERIKRIWTPIANDDLVIPFCTPVIQNPTALVIGLAHSNFDPGNLENGRRIALAFSLAIPTTVNTYLDHNHPFAVGLRNICERAEIILDAAWVGTNRCAVQGDFENIKCRDGYDNARIAMDGVVKDLM